MTVALLPLGTLAPPLARYEEVWIPTLCAALGEGVATVVGAAGGETNRYVRIDGPEGTAAGGDEGGEGREAADGGGGGGGGGGCALTTLRKLRVVLRGGTAPCKLGAGNNSGAGGNSGSGSGSAGGVAGGGRCAWTSHPEDRFRFRPSWPCNEFLTAVAAEDAGFWHPVKERECWLGYLDSCNTTACII